MEEVQAQQQNKWEGLFESFLATVEFSLVHYEFGKTSENDEGITGHWGLHDDQGANLGGIEGDVFDTAEQIINRMDVYIRDYFYEDLEQEVEDYELCLPDDMLLESKYGKEIHWRGTAYWLAVRAELSENNQFVKDHNYEFDILDMIANHTDDIDLYNINHEEA